MTFSIRELLAVAFVAALAMVAWRERYTIRQEQEKKADLLVQNRDLELTLHLGNDPMHQAVIAIIDEQEALGRVRDVAAGTFPKLEQKYSQIVPAGPDVVSIRRIPSIRSDHQKAPTSFRVVIPESGKIWIKFGVRLTDKNRSTGWNPENEDQLLDTSPFDDTGPFEAKLPPGEHVLSFGVGDKDGDMLPMQISLDDQPLLRSAFRAPGASGHGGSALGATEQIDFPLNMDRLPSLTSMKMYQSGLPEKPTQKAYTFSIWLSERSSEFDSFPGEGS